jgi:hypothetical protein
LLVLLLCRHPHCLYTKPQSAASKLSFQQDSSSASFPKQSITTALQNLVIIAVAGGSIAL